MTISSPESTESVAIKEQSQENTENNQRAVVITAVVFLVLLLVGIITALYFLLRPQTPAESVERIRDVFIIFMALESLLIGAALVVLIVQFASLINLLQNEVRPLLDSTNETVNHLRGTAEFLGENFVAPVIKLNGYLAGMQRMLELFGVKKK